MPKFIVFAHKPQVPPPMSTEEMQQHFQRFVASTDSLRQQGRLLAMEQLADEGRVLRAQGDDVIVTDWADPESKEVLNGFVMFEAASYDEALALLEDWPRPRYFGGSLELRQIEPT